MLLGRAFVLGVSVRGLLAVAAMALTVAYALVATGAMAGLETSSRTVEEAQAAPGWVVFEPQGGALPDRIVQPDWRRLVVAEVNGTRWATVTPWPFEDDRAWLGTHAAPPPDGVLEGLNASRSAADYAPPDAHTIPPVRFAALAGDAGRTVAAFVADEERPVVPGAYRVAPWTGVGVFYEEGAQQIVSSLVLVVVGSSAIVGLLGSAFLHLEVRAREADLRTVAALGGRRRVIRLMFLRSLVLVGAALVVGTAVGFTVFRSAAALGAAPFAVDRPVVAVLLALMAFAGIVAGMVAAARALGSFRTGGRGGSRTRRFPGPVRFLTLTPRVSPGIVAAVLLAALVLSGVLQTAAVPAQIFGTRGDEIVLVEASANPLRGRADRFLGEQARFLPGVGAAWPEVYAPSTFQGEPVLVRGVDFEAWREPSRAVLVAGAWPSADGEATVGVRLSDRLGIGRGDVLHLPRSYHHGVERLLVVGTHETGGLEDDEVLTGVEAAGRLAGLPADQVTLVRVRPEVPGTPWSTLAPGAGIEVLDVRLEPARPAPFAPFDVVVRAANFGSSETTRPIAVRVDGNLSAHDVLRVAGRDVVERRYAVLAPGALLFDVSVNPSVTVGAATDFLRVQAPDRVPPGSAFTVAVKDVDGRPVADAELLFDGQTVATTSAEGTARLAADGPALVTVSARSGERAGGKQVVVAPTEWIGTTHLVVEDVFIGAPRFRGASAEVPVETTLVNLGTEAEAVPVTWRVDGSAGPERTLLVPPGRRATFESVVAAAPGGHTLAVLERNVSFVVPQPTPGEAGARPGSVEEALQVYEEERRRGAGRGTGGSAGDFLDRTFAGLSSATSIVVVATVLHAGALVWVTVVREARERARVQETLRLIGAAHHRVEGQVLRDAFLAVLPAVAVGSLLAGVLLEVAQAFGWPRAFGHALPTAGSWDIVFRAAATVLVVALVAAFYAAQERGHRAPDVGPGRDLVRQMEAWR